MSELRYKWRKTWPDRENDFAGRDGEVSIGRIYVHTYGPQKDRWFWAVADDGSSGIANSAREAAGIVERIYEQKRDGRK